MDPQPRLTLEEESKDAFFRRLADLGQEMIDAHGADFATGAFVLAARWIAEGRMKRGEPVAAGVSGTSSTGDAARRRAGPSASASDRQ